MWLNYLNIYNGHFFCIDTLDLSATNKDGTGFVFLFPHMIFSVASQSQPQPPQPEPAT